jgi:hypothetical protein
LTQSANRTGREAALVHATNGGADRGEANRRHDHGGSRVPWPWHHEDAMAMKRTEILSQLNLVVLACE